MAPATTRTIMTVTVRPLPLRIQERLASRPYAPLLRRIGELGQQHEIPVYAVGGVVRDLFLDRPTTDIDFVTVGPGTGIRLARLVARALGGRTVHVYENFGTAAIRVPTPDRSGVFVLEFVAARRESYRKDSRKPIVEDGTLDDDLRRRDFTINAMAIDLWPSRWGTLIDPFHGRRDLRQRLLRTPLDPRQTFEDDPLRMIRAARFAAQLNFRVEPDTFAAMREKAHRVEILSQERITDELQKILCAPQPSIGFKILESTGILARIFPELVALKGVETIDGHRHKDNFYHTLQVVDNVARMTADRPCEDDAVWLRWAALLHDIAKPATKRFVPGTGWTFHGHEDLGARMVPRIFRRFKLPMDERMAYVQKLVRLHHRPVALVDEQVTDSAIRRLLFEAGDDLEDLMLLVRADITSKNPRRVRRYLEAFDRLEARMAEVEEKDRIRNFQPPVDGEEIMRTLGIGEGVAVGIIKEAIKEAILEGRIPNEHDAAFQYMMEIKDEALRRAALFEEMAASLKGPERRALGAIKEVIFKGELPADREEALAYLHRVKEEALAQAEEPA
ncbi:polynucleotide adenylyltransferase/metal dependent phosphohydrolase [Rhodothermus marinus DSM 4252]|uniref:Polynucleotide adenylyltransferase/metal dependent phosphohydrolase n=2 Tax=Rhodothermus marinus TaxID=29549 RepID=D0MFT1_RHOM4|nr:polynucleotide adenylyltransferase/metal dependent phosphohydrolase [Rhodothermus marinus DSM 4252]